MLGSFARAGGPLPVPRPSQRPRLSRFRLDIGSHSGTPYEKTTIKGQASSKELTRASFDYEEALFTKHGSGSLPEGKSWSGPFTKFGSVSIRHSRIKAGSGRLIGQGLLVVLSQGFAG